MEIEHYWIGIDVGEKNTSICFLTRQNEIHLSKAPGTNTREIASVLANVDPKCIEVIVLEASTGHRLPRELAALGFPIVTVDPRVARKFLSIRAIKSDDNDARGLAEIAKYGIKSSLCVHVKNVACEQIRMQLTLRDQLISQRVAVRNALRSHLRTLGSERTRLPAPTKMRDELQSDLDHMKRAGLGDSVPEILTLLEMVEAFESCARRLDVRMKKSAESNPVTARFLGIPGVGPVTALSFYSAIENPHRFSRSTDVGDYLGLVPALRQSGSMSRSGRITRAGNRLTRGHLYMSAGVIISRSRDATALRDWAKSLQERIGFGKARIALARKLAVVMLTIWKAEANFKAYPQDK